jgi:hypothetical protein
MSNSFIYFFGGMAFHVMSLSILTFRIMTLSPKDLFATLSINYIHYNGTISSANMLSVAPHLLLWRMSLGIVVIMPNLFGYAQCGGTIFFISNSGTIITTLHFLSNLRMSTKNMSFTSHQVGKPFQWQTLAFCANVWVKLKMKGCEYGPWCLDYFLEKKVKSR